jgi:diketogulonate reductase-like aldo/keto reductase
MEYVTAAGESIPALGLGTYQLRGRSCTETVRRALDVGYRHLDTAEYYDNESAVGEAIADSPVDRSELFLTTKVWRTNLAYDDAIRSARESLRKLGTDYVDLLLIHWPSRSVPTEETLRAFEDLREEGVVRHVGVSNFSVAQLREAIAAADAPILTNQIQYHPFQDQGDLLAYCVENDVTLTAYSPLAKGRVATDETLREIGDRHGKTAAQVALRWFLQQECVAAIPKASSEAHLRENFDVFDFELSDAEMERVFDLQGGLVSRVREALGL